MFIQGHHRAVITGIGVVAPNGCDHMSFWGSLLSGESAIGPVTRFEAEGLRSLIAGEVTGFDPDTDLPEGMAKGKLARHTQMAVVAAASALADAKFSRAEWTGDGPVDVVVGSGIGAFDVVGESALSIAERGYRAAPPSLVTKAAPQSAGTAVAKIVGGSTRVQTISTTCASGMDAVGQAAAMVRSGASDLVICGGTDAPIAPVPFANMTAAGLSSTKNAQPKQASRPFDEDCDSGVVSEGAGVVVVESLSSAMARGVTPYLEIKGFATAIDPDPQEPGSGYVDSMRAAMADAPIYPEEIDYICAWGPGHPVLDKVEAMKIREVFGERSRTIPVSSIKGVIGNPFAAAGPLMIAACAFAFRDNLVPPTANSVRGNFFELDIIRGKARQLELGTILANAHGVGGGNSTIVLGKVAS